MRRNTVHSIPSEVDEKIHLEKHLPFNPGDKVGPTTDLYFHELPSDISTGQKVFRFIVCIILTILFALTLPLFAILIKSSRERVLRKIYVTGKRGRTFPLYLYSTRYSDSSEFFWAGHFLYKTGLYRLPAVINLWRGEINLVGPHPYPKEWCTNWNVQLSDFYKRFNLKPGFFGVAEYISDPDDLDKVAKAFKKELLYILKPSLKKDVKRLCGFF